MTMTVKYRRKSKVFRNALISLLIFMMLPWLFMAHIPQTFQYAVEQPAALEPVTIPDFAPVPAAYPVVLQWMPQDLTAVEGWTQTHYPGSLVSLDMLNQIDRAAKEANVNLGILLGILTSEQSMLSPTIVGFAHASQYVANPFDYGVWPGSPFPFAIGAYASAKGAASLAARSIESFPSGVWTGDQYIQWMGFFESWYVNGVAAISAIGDWGQTLSYVWQSISQYVVNQVPTWFDNVTSWINNATATVVQWVTNHKAGLYVAGLVALSAILVVGAVVTGGGLSVAAGGAMSATITLFNANFSAALSAT